MQLLGIKDKQYQLFRIGVGTKSIIQAYIPDLDKVLSNYNYRFIMLRINSTTSGSCVQYSHLEFIDKFDQIFDFAKCGADVSLIHGSGMIPSEHVGNTITPFKYVDNPNHKSSNKVCFDPARYSLDIVIDLKSEALNIKKYNRWRWRYSNDTNVHQGRNMKDFDLLVSNDLGNEKEWKQVSHVVGQTYDGVCKDGDVACTIGIEI